MRQQSLVVHRKEREITFVLGSGLVLSVLDYQSLGAGFDARMEVYLSFLSFFTCVSRVILTIAYIRSL